MNLHFIMVHRIRPEINKACGSLLPNTSIRFTEMPSGPPTLATIVIELYGKNDEVLRSTAENVAAVLKETEGLVDIDIMQDDLYTSSMTLYQIKRRSFEVHCL